MLNPADFLRLDAQQIGYQCGTSEATVVRFCQRTGTGLERKKLALELATAGILGRRESKVRNVLACSTRYQTKLIGGQDYDGQSLR